METTNTKVYKFWKVLRVKLYANIWYQLQLKTIFEVTSSLTAHKVFTWKLPADLH